MNDQKDDSGGFLSDKQYSLIKFLTIIVLPAVGTLYFALATIWGFPSAEQVLGTLMAIQIFIGTLLGISTKQYKQSDARFDGTLTTSETPQKKIVSVETNLHPDDLAKKDEILLKVK